MCRTYSYWTIVFHNIRIQCRFLYHWDDNADAVTGSLSPEAPPFLYSRVHRMHRVPVQRPTLYDGKTPWDAYRIQYEMTAEINGWDESEKARLLVTSLTGAAMSVLQTLPAEDHHSYQRVGEGFKCKI